MHGSYNSPIVLKALDLSIAQSIDLDAGWSWVSFNLENNDLSLDSTLSYLTPSSDDQFIDFNAGEYSEYSNNYENGSWVGSLLAINNQSMYQIEIAEPDKLTVIGLEVTVSENPIPYVSGWNWIAYSPQISMEIDDALSDASVVEDEIDLIKGRFGFAEYVDCLLYTSPSPRD